MSSSRVDPNVSSVPVETPKAARQAPATPFSSVLDNSAQVLGSGTQSNTGVVGGPGLAAATREAANQALGAAGSGVAGTAGIVNAGTPGSEMSQMHAMQRESQSFNLQLLNLQQEVQDENRRFTTISNVIKAAHDTAKGAVGNIRS